MAKVRTYEVTLIPAKREDRCLTFQLFDPKSKKYTVEADALHNLDAEIRRLIQTDFKMDCTAAVFVPRGERKPPGFDAYKQANFRFIEYKAPAEVAA